MTGRRRVKRVWQVKKDVVPPKPPTVGDEVIEESGREQRYARLVSELEAIELANERNPHDVEILKKWAKTLESLGYYHFDENQAMFYLQEAKSKLEEALGIKEDYYEAKFELGRVHYRMLVSNKSLKHRYPRLVSELEAAELANEQNPHDVKNLKKWAETLVSFSVFFDGNQEERMYYIREANSKLEEALGIQIDYEAMFELGMVHYAMMLLGQSKEDILGHSRKANVLFVQVEDRAPDVYKDDMLHHVSYQTMVKLKVPDSLEHLITEDDEMDEGVGTISTYKLEMIFDALDMLFEKLGLDPDDTVSKNVLVKALHRLPIRDPNEGEKSARGK